MTLKISEERKSRLGLGTAVLMTGIVFAGIISTHYIKHFHNPPSQIQLLHILPLSALGIIAYTFFGYYHLFGNVVMNIPGLLKTSKVKNIFIAIAAWSLLYMVFKWLAGSPPHRNWGYFFEKTIAQGLHKPLGHLVSHVVYGGPIFFFFLFFF